MKLLALLLAVITYFYVQTERENAYHGTVVTRDREASGKSTRWFTKTVPIHARLKGNPAPEYRVIMDRVSRSPSQITLVGSQTALESVNKVETGWIDISGCSKTFVKKVPLENIGSIRLNGEENMVEVTIPVEKIDL